MASIPERRNSQIAVTLSVGVGLLALSSCTANTAENQATAEARALVEQTTAIVTADVADFDGSDFESFVREGGLRVLSLYGDDGDIQLEYLDGTSSALVDVDENEGRGTVELLSMGFGEGGGGHSYEQAKAYLCWALDIDVATRSVQGPRNVECSEDVVAFVRGAQHITL